MRALVIVPANQPEMRIQLDRADHAVLVHTWTAVQSRPDSRTWYAVARVGGRLVYMHTLITGWKGVDHTNGDGLDNRRDNLRTATAAENNTSQPKRRSQHGVPCVSRYKGVARNGRRWMALCGPAGSDRYLGTFTTEEEAARAYNERALALWGEFAYLNDVEAS